MKLMPVLAAAGLVAAALSGPAGTATAAPLLTKTIADVSHAPVTQVRYGKHHRGHIRGYRGFTKSFKYYSPRGFYRHRGYRGHRNSFRIRGIHGKHRFGGFSRGYTRH